MKSPFGRVRLLGPILFYDLICLARRRRYVVLRTLFPVALLLLLCLVFKGVPRSGPGGTVTNNDMAALAGTFFYAFIAVQFALAVLLTPAYTAGAIAEEKDRRRIDFLFATDLENQEIVLGKLLARVGNLLCLLLAGLPVLSFVQFWGGVDPELVLVGYAALGLTVVSAASLSIYQSVRARKARDAIVTTYLFLFAYFGLSYLPVALLSHPIATFTLLPWPRPITVGTLIRALGSGNVLFVQAELREALNAGIRLSSELPGALAHYALFHLLLAVVFVAAAIRQVRRLALTEARTVRKPSSSRLRAERWLRPGNEPMLWKELCIDRGLSFNRVGRVLVVLIVLGSFVPAVWNVGWLLWDYWFNSASQGRYPGYWTSKLGSAINAWVRQVGIAVACLTILGAAVRAASSVSNEREQETLDSLLASPLDTSRILFAKWVSSLWSVRWGLLWLALVWTIGILMSGLNLVILPWLVLSWFVYASFFVSLGLWFSVRTNRTLTATVSTLTWTAVLSIGQILPWLLLGMPRRSAREASGLLWLSLFQSYGMTPPMALGWLSFRGMDFQFFSSSAENAWEIFQAIIMSLVVWIVGARILLAKAGRRFERERIDGHERPDS